MTIKNGKDDSDIPVSKSLGNHKKRILTSILIGPAFFALLWWGDRLIFNISVLAITSVCLFEFYTITFEESALLKYSGIFLGALWPFLTFIFHSLNGMALAAYLTFFSSALLFIIFYKKFNTNEVLKTWAIFFLALSYIGITTSHLVLLREFPLGRQHVIFLLAVIFAGDIGAYYVGSTMGKNKLCPHVSKGKTVEGAIGGLIANAVAGAFFWKFFFKDVSLGLITLMVLGIGIAGQMGDLAESIIKRSYGVKDSGGILPGHGGLLDRLDAMLMAVPAFYWILILLKKYEVFA